MTALATDLAAQLYVLAARVQSNSLLPWQVERLRAALAPELAILARCDERGHEPNRYRCRYCGSTFADLGSVAEHGRAAHRRNLAGESLPRLLPQPIPTEE